MSSTADCALYAFHNRPACPRGSHTQRRGNENVGTCPQSEPTVSSII